MAQVNWLDGPKTPNTIEDSPKAPPPHRGRKSTDGRQPLQSHNRLPIETKGIEGFEFIQKLRELGYVMGIPGRFDREITCILEGKTLGFIETPELQLHFDHLYLEVSFMISKATEQKQKRSVSQLVANFDSFCDAINAPKYSLKTDDTKFVDEKILESSILHLINRLALTSK